MCKIKNNLLLAILVLLWAAEDLILAALAETGDAMLLAAEFITELKSVRAALDALTTSDGNLTATPE